MTRQELTEKREALLKRLREVDGSTVHKLVVHREERRKLHAELDEIEEALDSLDD